MEYLMNERSKNMQDMKFHLNILETYLKIQSHY